MKVKNFKHHINWQGTWNKMREERVGKPKVSYDDAFFKKSAQDFSQRVKSNDYEFGRKATQILKQILDHDSEVLEIGTGPGTLTIPLAAMVKKIIGLRIFNDADGKFNLSLVDVGGSVLVISQFTLLGDCRKGQTGSHGVGECCFWRETGKGNRRSDFRPPVLRTGAGDVDRDR